MSVKDNVKFNDEYNALDKVLREKYFSSDESGKSAITLYINEMRQKEEIGRVKADSWREDYKKLRTLRNARNEMTHEGGYTVSYFKKSDIKWISAFRDRVLLGSDPIAKIKEKPQPATLSLGYIILALLTVIIPIAFLALMIVMANTK